jgi:hypothetical protein
MEKDIEAWLRELVRVHSALVIRNKGGAEGKLHKERVFAYKNVLVHLGFGEHKSFSDCLEGNESVRGSVSISESTDDHIAEVS